MDVVQALPVQTDESKMIEMESEQVVHPSNSTPVKGVEHPARVVSLKDQISGERGLGNLPPLLTRVNDLTIDHKVDKGKNKVDNLGVLKKPWSELFKDNRAPSQCAELEDTSQNDRTGFCFLDEDDLLPTKVAWGHTLIGYFAGKFPGSWGVKNLIKKLEGTRESSHPRKWLDCIPVPR